MEKRKCVQCSRSFTLTASEIDFYKSKGLSLPKRCKTCREENRNGAPGRRSKRKTYTVTSKGKRTSGRRFACVLLIAVINAVFYTTLKDYFVPVTAVFDISAVIIAMLLSKRFGSVRITDFDTGKYRYTFYDKGSMVEHYAKHGRETGCRSMEEYLKKANDTIRNPSSLHKKQSEDGDDAYFLKSTGDFAVVAKSGYIRTYYKASYAYFQKQ